MDMSKDVVEFKWLESKPLTSDTVTFELEDGATVKVTVDIQRAGVALNYTNPDGTQHYNIAAGLRVTVVPPAKKFFLPRSQLMVRKGNKPEPPSII